MRQFQLKEDWIIEKDKSLVNAVVVVSGVFRVSFLIFLFLSEVQILLNDRPEELSK